MYSRTVQLKYLQPEFGHEARPFIRGDVPVVHIVEVAMDVTIVLGLMVWAEWICSRLIATGGGRAGGGAG
jgi:hypothetical protein